MSAKRRARRRVSLLRDLQGSVAIHVAVMMIAITGFAALGIEVGYLLLKHRQMQSAADSAAMSGATALGLGYPADFRMEARAVSAASGYTDGTDGTTVTVNSPPLSGPNAGNSSAVEVIVSQPQTLSLIEVYRAGLFDVGARAVALAGAGSYCILQLNAGASGGFSMSNGAKVYAPDCAVAVDSAASPALIMNGGARLDTQLVSVVGSASISNGARIDPSGALKTSQAPVADPYASVAVPAYSGCSNGTARTYNYGNWTLTPGVFCNGVSFQNAANVTMQPGAYIIDRGTFLVGGGAKLVGVGVTIILTSSTGNGYATVDIGNGAHVSLSAPTAGATAGLIFFGDPNAPESNTNYFRGGVSIDVTGAIYFPSQRVNFQNGSSNTSACTELIAGTIVLEGGSKFRNDCPSSVKPIGGGLSQLVE